MFKTAYGDTGGLTPKPLATISVQRSHWATLVPAVPEVYEMLRRHVIEFEAGGPLGHTMRPAISDEFTEVITRRTYDPVEGRIMRTPTQTFPQGMVPAVTERLHELGYDVVVNDRREDSPQWKLADDWKETTPKLMRKVVKAICAEKALRVITPNTALIVDTIAAVAVAYPTAKIAVAVGTKKQLKAIRIRLRRVFREKPLGLYTASVKTPGRVSVGMIRQFPRGEKGAFDLLILPYVEQALTDEALRVVTSGQFRRVLSFAPDRWSSDENIDRRLMVVAGTVFPPEKAKIPVAVVMLATHGTKPIGKFENKLVEKRELYWHNTRRNRRIAHVAKQLALAKKGSVRAVGGDGTRVKELLVAAKNGVCILVETPEHATELAKLLPGWAVWTANDLRVEQPEAKCGVIATEMGAAEMVMTAGVMIRATGTEWPFPKTVDWPCTGTVERCVLIDFADEYHPVALKNAQARFQSYEKAGMTVWVQNNTVAAKE